MSRVKVVVRNTEFETLILNLQLPLWAQSTGFGTPNIHGLAARFGKVRDRLKRSKPNISLRRNRPVDGNIDAAVKLV